jgi:RNA polymerase sigma-70 factor (ECF subfamily)
VEVETASEVDLWGASLAGDGAAFGELFDLHRDRVFAHARRMTETRQDAEDVTAAAFLELWRRRGDVRLVARSVLPWLFVTATNVALNVNRATRRHRRLLAKLPRDDTAPDPAVGIVEKGLTVIDPRLRRSLVALSEKDRTLVALVVFENYSLAEAAALIGLSETAAKSRLHRARGRLRASLTSSSSSDQPTETGGCP